MKIHRFYVGETKSRFGALELHDHMWVNDKELVNQWLKVLRLRSGEELVLFDGQGLNRLYKITEVEPASVRLQHVTDIASKKPDKSVHLAWALLKKDNNDFILQKATELGVTHFHPVVSDRTEKTGFDAERAHKIVIEAAEQCGRSEIPTIHEPRPIRELVGQYAAHMPVYIADMNAEKISEATDNELMVCVGPEGGWTDQEREFFVSYGVKHLHLGMFTLRAETAAIVAVQQLM